MILFVPCRLLDYRYLLKGQKRGMILIWPCSWEWGQIRFSFFILVHYCTIQYGHVLSVLKQCCGSGIRCLFDPGNRNRFYPDPVSRILDPKPIFWELSDNFWVKRFIILWKLSRITFFSIKKKICEIWGYKKRYKKLFFTSFVAVFGSVIRDG